MLTMLYDAETLKPSLLVDENIKNGDVGKKFYVINGCWDGTFNGDSIVIHSPYGDSIPSTVYKCYNFKSPPPSEYYEVYNKYYQINSMGIQYEVWFWYFEDLVESGEIE